MHRDDVPALEARYNISPTQQVFAVRTTDEGREGVFLKWGLGPSWAADPSIGVKMLNARAETVTEKPAFRAAFLRRRCLFASDGFYEWRVSGKKKLPVHFHMRDGRLFLLGPQKSWRSFSRILGLMAEDKTAPGDRPGEECSRATPARRSPSRPRGEPAVPKFMSCHTMPAGALKREQVDQLAVAAQRDPVVKPYRSFLNLAEGKACCVMEVGWKTTNQFHYFDVSRLVMGEGRRSIGSAQ